MNKWHNFQQLNHKEPLKINLVTEQEKFFFKTKKSGSFISSFTFIKKKKKKKKNHEKVEIKLYFNLALATNPCVCVIRLLFSSGVRHIGYERFYQVPCKPLPECMRFLTGCNA